MRAICLKSGHNVSRSWQKKIFICFLDCCKKKLKIKIAFAWSCLASATVLASCFSRVYNQVKPKICSSLITINVATWAYIHTSDLNMNSCFVPLQPLLLLALQHGPYPPIDTGGCYVQQLAQHHKVSTARLRAWKFCCPFSPYSVITRQGPNWETNVCADRIVLHLKSVMQLCSATKFCD